MPISHFRPLKFDPSGKWTTFSLWLTSLKNGAFQVVLVVKNPPANAGDLRDMGFIPGSGRSTGRGNSNPSMDRRNPWAKNLRKISTEVYEFLNFLFKIHCYLFTMKYLSPGHQWQKSYLSTGGAVVKNPPANAGDVGLIPGSGRSPGRRNSNSLQYSCLENPMDRGAWRGIVHGAAKCQIQLSTHTQVIFAVSW